MSRIGMCEDPPLCLEQCMWTVIDRCSPSEIKTSNLLVKTQLKCIFAKYNHWLFYDENIY